MAKNERQRIQRLIELDAQIAGLEDTLSKSDGRTSISKTRKARLANLKAERDELRKDTDTEPKVVAPDVLPPEDGDTLEDNSEGDE